VPMTTPFVGLWSWKTSEVGGWIGAPFVGTGVPESAVPASDGPPLGGPASGVTTTPASWIGLPLGSVFFWSVVQAAEVRQRPASTQARARCRAEEQACIGRNTCTNAPTIQRPPPSRHRLERAEAVLRWQIDGHLRGVRAEERRALV